ncbi:hypothetical protein [Streptomyces sp. NRRL WC-3742]|uniref:hypothetical protein n=1 Tax=Streptomyces sp. NRRL WC-3742 TaxID=1463934 RepID=UPI0004CBBAFE|nr:hypothetical protein [Streptomyces sp. NRRL WC-3742]
MPKLRSFAVATAAAATLVVGGLTATPASAATTSTLSCETWQDSNTFGARCTSNDGASWYRAWAMCQNGVTVWGQWLVPGVKDWWSYAYCTSVNSSLAYGGYSQG